MSTRYRFALSRLTRSFIQLQLEAEAFSSSAADAGGVA